MQNLTYGLNNLEVTDRSCFNGKGGQLKIVIGVGSRDKRRKVGETQRTFVGNLSKRQNLQTYSWSWSQNQQRILLNMEDSTGMFVCLQKWSHRGKSYCRERVCGRDFWNNHLDFERSNAMQCLRKGLALHRGRQLVHQKIGVTTDGR